jgi:hypothetical protein
MARTFRSLSPAARAYWIAIATGLAVGSVVAALVADPLVVLVASGAAAVMTNAVIALGHKHNGPPAGTDGPQTRTD